MSSKHVKFISCEWQLNAFLPKWAQLGVIILSLQNVIRYTLWYQEVCYSMFRTTLCSKMRHLILSFLESSVVHSMSSSFLLLSCPQHSAELLRSVIYYSSKYIVCFDGLENEEGFQVDSRAAPLPISASRTVLPFLKRKDLAVLCAGLTRI